jgi:hypothetical protein
MKYTIALINLASFALAINFPQLNEEATDRMFKRLDGDQNGKILLNFNNLPMKALYLKLNLIALLMVQLV